VTFELLVEVIDFTPPDGDDTLLTLDQATWLPFLAMNFDSRQLLREANAGRLRSTRPTNKYVFTTRTWVKDWIEKSCPAQGSQRASGTMRKQRHGASSTPAASVALVSARNSVQRLRSASKTTS
jgi:hypothetical protein